MKGFAPNRCGDFCGYTPSKRCEMVGSTHNLPRIACVCKLLKVGDIEQSWGTLNGANF